MLYVVSASLFPTFEVEAGRKVVIPLALQRIGSFFLIGELRGRFGRRWFEIIWRRPGIALLVWLRGLWRSVLLSLLCSLTLWIRAVGPIAVNVHFVFDLLGLLFQLSHEGFKVLAIESLFLFPFWKGFHASAQLSRLYPFHDMAYINVRLSHW